MNKQFKINTFPALGLNALMAFFPYYGRDYWGPTAMLLYSAGTLVEKNRIYSVCSDALYEHGNPWGPDNLNFFAVGVELDYYSVMCDNALDIMRKDKCADQKVSTNHCSTTCDTDAKQCQDIDCECYCSIMYLYPDLDSDSSSDGDSYTGLESDTSSEYFGLLDSGANSDTGVDTHLMCPCCANANNCCANTRNIGSVQSTSDEVIERTDVDVKTYHDIDLWAKDKCADRKVSTDHCSTTCYTDAKRCQDIDCECYCSIMHCANTNNCCANTRNCSATRKCSFCTNRRQSTSNEMIKCTDTKMMISAGSVPDQLSLKHISRNTK